MPLHQTEQPTAKCHSCEKDAQGKADPMSGQWTCFACWNTLDRPCQHQGCMKHPKADGVRVGDGWYCKHCGEKAAHNASDETVKKDHGRERQDTSHRGSMNH